MREIGTMRCPILYQITTKDSSTNQGKLLTFIHLLLDRIARTFSSDASLYLVFSLNFSGGKKGPQVEPHPFNTHLIMKKEGI